MVKVKYLLPVAMLLFVFNGFSQDLKYNPTLISKSGEVDTSIINTYWQTSSEFFRDPKVPQFIFVTPNAKFSLGIGGYVNGTANFDFNGYAEGPDFIPSLIQTPNDDVKDGQFNFDAKHTRLYFKVIDFRQNGQKVVAYIESDFRGGESNFLRLRKAYISYGGFEVGQDWTTMLDLAAFPAMVNFQGPNGALGNRVVKLRYAYNISPRWKLAVALEEPYFAINATGLPAKFESRSQHSPNIPAYIQYTNGESHFRLSTLLNPMYYHNSQTHEKQVSYGWAAQLSGIMSFSRSVSFSFNGFYGEGVANQTQDLYGEGYTLIPKVSYPDKLKPLPIFGGYANLCLKLNQDVMLNGGCSMQKLASGNFKADDWYRRGTLVWANAFWNPLPYMQVGLEYSWGERQNMNSVKGTANRLSAMVQYNF